MRQIRYDHSVVETDLRLEEAGALVEEGSKIIEVQQLEIEALKRGQEILRREVARLRIAAAETPPTDSI